MKANHLICSAVLAAALVTLPSCKDEGSTDSTPANATGQEATSAPEAKPVPPTVDEVSAMLKGQLGESAIAEAGDITLVETTQNQDGSFSVSADIALTLREDIFVRENAPESFNSERKAANEGINNAMLPEAGYLLQVGAPTEMITDEDRAAKALSEDLQKLANELKELAESSVYRQVGTAGQTLTLRATFRATREGEGWAFSDVALDNAALLEMEAGTPRAALPEGTPVLTPEFEEARKAEIREKATAFNTAAQPFIQGREEAARTRLVQYRAAREEELRRAAEQAEADELAREDWANRCAKYIADDKLFAGEWTRGNRFGELTIHIARTMRHDNSIQFFGSLYDTKLPAARLDITGRCDLTQVGDKSHIDINIYDGQYDPDQPTAEVFDAGDSVMVLSLTPDGKLDGIMSCESWKDTPEKEFKIRLAPSKEKSRKR